MHSCIKMYDYRTLCYSNCHWTAVSAAILIGYYYKLLVHMTSMQLITRWKTNSCITWSFIHNAHAGATAVSIRLSISWRAMCPSCARGYIVPDRENVVSREFRGITVTCAMRHNQRSSTLLYMRMSSLHWENGGTRRNNAQMLQRCLCSLLKGYVLYTRIYCNRCWKFFKWLLAAGSCSVKYVLGASCMVCAPCIPKKPNDRTTRCDWACVRFPK